MRYAAVSLFVCVATLFALPASASAQTSEWTTCASEGGYCAFTGTQEVRYGANGFYFYKTLSGGTACTNSVFGDPLIWTAKACAVRRDRQSGVVGFVLVNASDESDIRSLTDGVHIDMNALGLAAAGLNIRADATSDVTHVALYLNGVFQRVETSRPFALFGDSNGNYNFGTLAAGRTYTVDVVPSTGTSVSLTFSVVGGTNVLPTSRPGVLGLVLANASNERDIRPLSDGMQIDAQVLGLAAAALNIRADATSEVTHVAFYVNGVFHRTEMVRPFALFGDLNGNYNFGTLAAGGTYTVDVVPSTGTSVRLTFSVVGGTSGLPTSSVKGRVAISSDGNAHDCDDILATAVSIAILAKSGNADKLRYYGYDDHLWGTESACDQNATDFGTRAAREYQMKLSAEETARRFGGFDPYVFYDVVNEPQAAINILAAEIARSSVGDPLWLIGAGPMQIIGLALEQAASLNRSSLAHVYVISHNTWNSAHAEVHLGTAGYTFTDLGVLGVNLIGLIDQNAADLNVAASNYAWLTSSGDPNLAWLMERAFVAGRKMDQSQPVYFDNSNNNLRFDASDAGMVFWLVTGRGDQTVSMSEIQAMLLR